MDRYKRRVKGEFVPRSHTFRMRNRAGEEFWGQLNNVLTRWKGKPAVLCFLKDITDQKRLEAQLQQAQRMESIGTLAGGIAHDFNNILGGILGYASLTKAVIPSDHKIYSYVETIERSAVRAAELTAQLLGFARGGKYKVAPVDLNHVVDDTMKIISRTLDKSIDIEIRRCEQLPTVEADAGQLEQVLMNLCVNAGEAMPAGGTLTIETDVETLTDEYVKTHVGAKPGPCVTLSVTDTGIGMNKETRERIFEPFFTTKGEGKGTGLGLSMVYGVVKNHEGYVDVRSEPGHGTTFNIYLPVSGKPEEKESSEVDTPLQADELILVVDDEEAIRSFVKEVLGRNGYRVLLAKDGAEAINVYQQHDGDIGLIILDMVMPKMGGQETFLRLRAHNPGVKVLLSTGYSQSGKAQEILDTGVMGFIQKPYRPNALLAKVRSVLDATKTPA
jgi:signal transduction histidine kinase/CheY-like chemotaxis protein